MQAKIIVDLYGAARGVAGFRNVSFQIIILIPASTSSKRTDFYI